MGQPTGSASEHGLKVLEFDRVLRRVADRATSAPGRERVLALRPEVDPERVRAELARVSCTVRLISEYADYAGAVPDLTEVLDRLSADGWVLAPEEVRDVGVTLASSRTLRSSLLRQEGAYPELEGMASRLFVDEPIERTIHRSVDEDGTMRSTASRELQRIRNRLRGAHQSIVRKLEGYLKTLPDRYIVPDSSVSIRDGRYVVPIRREGKREVGGIVHDSSQTGGTLFVEPPGAIEAMNDLRELENEEHREVRRILAEITAQLRPNRSAIAETAEALIDFDTLWARARTAVAWKGVPPEVLDGSPEGFVLRDARHPLLVESEGGDVVPYDFVLGQGERCVVVSGPNTGGKSVFLKAVGLIAALTQSGVVPPVGRGTKLPVFTAFHADIGDEQSIAHSLSTYSAHLHNLSKIVTEADRGSLVLIDEMGTGTDPAEGAALARSILEELVGRGSTILASSHLGDLKQLDGADSGIVNASLQFDSERMAPTYSLLKGRPGRSYGLEIARKLGFDPRVVDRAETLRDDGEARLDEVLKRLEEQESDVERLASQLEAERRSNEGLRNDLEAREQVLVEAERSSEGRARAEARRVLMSARDEVERVIAELRARVRDGDDFDEAARAARRGVEEAARGEQRALEALERKTAGSARNSDEVEVGAAVRIRNTGTKGRLVEVREGRGVVEAGALRFEVAISELEEVAAADGAPRKGGWRGPPKGEVRTEVDLRGLRVDEVDVELERALDHAILEDLGQLRIIHGKGTGALRQRVAEILDADGRVGESRMGGPTEGGTGVTVATFRG